MIKVSKLSPKINLISEVNSLTSPPYTLVSEVTDFNNEKVYHYKVNINVNMENLISRSDKKNPHHISPILDVRVNTRLKSIDTRFFSKDAIQRADGKINGAAINSMIIENDQIRKERMLQFTKNRDIYSTNISLLEAFILTPVIIKRNRGYRKRYKFGAKKIWNLQSVKKLNERGMEIRLPQLQAGSISNRNLIIASNIANVSDDDSESYLKGGLREGCVQDNNKRPQAQQSRFNKSLKSKASRQRLNVVADNIKDFAANNRIYRAFNQSEYSNSFNKNYDESLKMGMDPVQTVNTMPSISSEERLFNDLQITTGQTSIKKAEMIASQRFNVVGQNRSIHTTRQLPETEIVAFMQTVENNIKTITFDLCVPERAISGKSQFYIIINSKTNSGIKNQSLTIKVDHIKLKEMKEIYVAVPKLKICQKGWTSITPIQSFITPILPASTKKEDFKYTIYQRKIFNCVPYSVSRFLQKSQRSSVMVRESSQVLNEGQAYIIFRVVPHLASGSPITNFSSLVHKNHEFIPTYSVFSTYSTKKGIVIKLISLPKNVASAGVLRRNITVSMDTRFRPLLGVSLKGSSNGTDPSVRENNVYEYKLVLYNKNGSVVESSTSRIEKRIIPMKMIRVTLKDKRKIQSNPTRSSTHGQKSSQLGKFPEMVLGFNISYSFFKKNENQIISQELKASGLYDAYFNDNAKNTASLDNLVMFSVDRLDETTGETQHIKMVRAGIIFDDGKNSIAPPALNGRKYTYRVTAYLVSPGEAIEEINRKSGQSLKGMADNRNPQKVLAEKNAKQIQSQKGKQNDINVNTYDNIYNTDTLNRGSIRSGWPDERSVLSRNCTGDFSEISFDMSEMPHTVVKVKNSVTVNPDGSVILRWSSKSNTIFVDFYIITCKKQAQDLIVGNAHPVSSGGAFTYIDLTSIDYVGKITYSVSAVMINGEKISPVEIGETTKGAPMKGRDDFIDQGPLW